jgi:hypothetical protein
LDIVAQGVGHIDRATSRSKFGNFAFAVFSVKFAAIALQLLGVGHIDGVLTCCAKLVPVIFGVIVPPRVPSEALGVVQLRVRDDPYAVASVRGTNGASWYAVPFRIIPERGQGSENCIHPSRKQRADVLHDNETRSQFANKTGDFVEQAAPLAFKSCAKSCKADVLAWEPAADDIDGNSIGSKSFCGKGAHVVIAGDAWPVLGEDFARERFNFTEGGCFKSVIICTFTFRAFKAERETANLNA